jgi:hypothetical protein
MASVIQPEVFVAVSAATNQGVLTVTSNGLILPGANGWLTKDDGSLQHFVRVQRIVGTTQLVVMRYPNDNPNTPGPTYGVSDESAFNGVATHLCIESQPVHLNPLTSTPIY